MAKDNLFLGFARGKVGSVVFYRTKGVQVTRALNSSPSNPQSPLQMLQRVTLKTASSSYSLLQDICNHSFEGVDAGTPSQSRFVQRNVAQMREQLAEYINSGDAESILGCIESNFNAKADTWPAMRPYVVSEGRAPVVKCELSAIGSDEVVLQLPYDVGENPSYDDVIQAFGLNRGDQITILFLSVNDTDTTYTYNGLHYARIIMEPANGDFTAKFIAAGKVNSPNARNKGAVGVAIYSRDDAHYLAFSAQDGGEYIVDGIAGKVNSLAAAAVIVSRQAGSIWQRSNSQLILRSSTSSVEGHLIWDHETGYLADAIASYLTAGAVSTAYLNQAVKAATSNE